MIDHPVDKVQKYRKDYKNTKRHYNRLNKLVPVILGKRQKGADIHPVIFL